MRTLRIAGLLSTLVLGAAGCGPSEAGETVERGLRPDRPSWAGATVAALIEVAHELSRDTTGLETANFSTFETAERRNTPVADSGHAATAVVRS